MLRVLKAARCSLHSHCLHQLAVLPSLTELHLPNNQIATVLEAMAEDRPFLLLQVLITSLDASLELWRLKQNNRALFKAVYLQATCGRLLSLVLQASTSSMKILQLDWLTWTPLPLSSTLPHLGPKDSVSPPPISGGLFPCQCLRSLCQCQPISCQWYVSLCPCYPSAHERCCQPSLCITL